MLLHDIKDGQALNSRIFQIYFSSRAASKGSFNVQGASTNMTVIIFLIKSSFIFHFLREDVFYFTV